MPLKAALDQASQDLLALDSKIALVGVLDDEGYPHIAFYNTLHSLGEKNLMFGQFMVGLSKTFIETRPDVAFLALSADLQWLRGHAHYTHKKTNGPEYDMYNAKPLFRYNTYFGINTIWYFDLLETTELQKLPMPKIIAGAVASRAAAVPLTGGNDNGALSPFAKGLFAKIDGLKFICYTDSRGLPSLLPIIQATHAGSGRIVFAGSPFGKELATIPKGSKVAVYCSNMDLQSVLVKGTFLGKKSGAYVLDIEKVYNSMPTANAYVFPREKKPTAIEEF